MRGLLLALLLVPSISSALDFKMGLMQTADPLYEGVYKDKYNIDDEGLVGRLELIQRFNIKDGMSINIFATHLSLFGERDPHHGINAIGVELEFNFKLGKR